MMTSERNIFSHLWSFVKISIVQLDVKYLDLQKSQIPISVGGGREWLYYAISTEFRFLPSFSPSVQERIEQSFISQHLYIGFWHVCRIPPH